MMLVTKTPCRNAYIAALARANDQLCFFLFADAELHPSLIAASTTRTAEFTPQVFPTNPYSKRINVSMVELVEFRSVQLTRSLGMSFASAVEQLLLYIESVILHCAEINQLSVKITEPIEECLESFYQTGTEQTLPATTLKTIKYLRLRRNHFIHLSEKPSAELAKFLRYDAHGIQAYWQSRTSIPGVNFGSIEVTSFMPDESIALIKIMRICIEDIDDCISPLIDAIPLVKNLHIQLLTDNPTLRKEIPTNLEKQVRKVRKRAKELYGVNGTEKEIANALSINL